MWWLAILTVICCLTNEQTNKLSRKKTRPLLWNILQGYNLSCYPGETSLKTRVSASLTKEAKTVSAISSLTGCLECENPNPKLDSFLGRMTLWSGRCNPDSDPDLDSDPDPDPDPDSDPNPDSYWLLCLGRVMRHFRVPSATTTFCWQEQCWRWTKVMRQPENGKNTMTWNFIYRVKSNFRWLFLK